MQEPNALPLHNIVSSIIAEADKMYEFIIKYSNSMNLPHDYGTGEKLNMIEAHLLTYIDDHPGVTPGQLAKLWIRSKGAISQQMKKLENRGLIEKRKQEGNNKTVYLYTTEQGREISMAHKIYDINDITSTLKILLQTCTMEEIAAFYKVIGAYVTLLDEGQ